MYALMSGVTLRDRLLVSTLHRLERDALFEPSAKNLFEGAMSGMTRALSLEYGDWHTQYIPPSSQESYQDSLDNRYEGLGFLSKIHEEEDEKKLFIAPHYDTPAYRAGLRSGDQIIEIDGMPVADKSHGEIYELLRQQPEAHLSVVPFGQTEPQDYVVPRERLRSDSVVGDYFDAHRRVFRLETHPQIGYIRISSFTPKTADEFSKALDSMTQSGVKSFILDLRDNSGGDVGSCTQIASMLIPYNPNNPKQNMIVTVRTRHGFGQDRTLLPGLHQCDLPMVVLINEETASASEILAATLQDHRRATIVGTRSFGKGVIQNIIELPFQSGILQLTSSEYRRPNGAGIQRRNNAKKSDEWGVLPDNIVEFSEAEQSAVLQYRLWRSSVISAERSEVLELFRQQIIGQNNDHEGDEEREPFRFIGNAPYYDAQLDEAVRVLLMYDQSRHP